MQQTDESSLAVCASSLLTKKRRTNERASERTNPSKCFIWFYPRSALTNHREVPTGKHNELKCDHKWKQISAIINIILSERETSRAFVNSSSLSDHLSLEIDHVARRKAQKKRNRYWMKKDKILIASIRTNSNIKQCYFTR